MNKGIEIRDMLGGPFEESKSHRKVLWALDVKIHQELFTTQDIAKANEILVKARNINAQIEETLK